jgi:hypothetical protein
MKIASSELAPEQLLAGPIGTGYVRATTRLDRASVMDRSEVLAARGDISDTGHLLQEARRFQ